MKELAKVLVDYQPIKSVKFKQISKEIENSFPYDLDELEFDDDED